MSVGIDFNEYDLENPAYQSANGLTGWVMAHSGGKITTKQQAALVMLIVAGIAVVLSLIFFFGSQTREGSGSGNDLGSPIAGPEDPNFQP